ncbi:MAG: site-2 protease family protein [Gemmatimonadota bacterium]
MTSLPEDTILEGTLREGLYADHPDVLSTLAAWTGRAYLHEEDSRVEVVLVYQLKAREAARFPWVHFVLFALTLLTTLGSGAMLDGVDPFRTAFLDIGSARIPYPTWIDFGALSAGALFALPFLGVLLAHEMAHYVAARSHGVRASLPYFIPFPPYYSVIGSLGAFIRLRGPSVRRSVLFDIGSSGPFASFLVSIPLVIYGFGQSRILPGGHPPGTPYLVTFFDQPVWLGSSLATRVLAGWAGLDPGATGAVLLHPLALVGWLGLFVTALNLLPLGQLDGGHVVYAYRPKVQRLVGRLFLLSLGALGFLWWGWWAWAALVLFLHRGGVGHPPLLQSEAPLGRRRQVLAWVLFGIFLCTFVTVPIQL